MHNLYINHVVKMKTINVCGVWRLHDACLIILKKTNPKDWVRVAFDMHVCSNYISMLWGIIIWILLFTAIFALIYTFFPLFCVFQEENGLLINSEKLIIKLENHISPFFFIHYMNKWVTNVITCQSYFSWSQIHIILL